MRGTDRRSGTPYRDRDRPAPPRLDTRCGRVTEVAPRTVDSDGANDVAAYLLSYTRYSTHPTHPTHRTHRTHRTRRAALGLVGRQAAGRTRSRRRSAATTTTSHCGRPLCYRCVCDKPGCDHQSHSSSGARNAPAGPGTLSSPGARTCAHRTIRGECGRVLVDAATVPRPRVTAIRSTHTHAHAHTLRRSRNGHCSRGAGRVRAAAVNRLSAARVCRVATEGLPRHTAVCGGRRVWTGPCHACGNVHSRTGGARRDHKRRHRVDSHCTGPMQGSPVLRPTGGGRRSAKGARAPS